MNRPYVKFRRLPRLPLVFPQVLNHKRAHVRNPQKTLARGVDGKPPQIASNPAAAKLLGDSRSCPAAAEAIQH